MEKIINVELLRNPVNWIIVVLMVTLGGIALHYVFAANAAKDAAE